MEPMKVRDLMVPIEDYATVPPGAVLREAVEALEQAQERRSDHLRSGYRHRAVVVVDDAGRAIGKVSMWDVLRALEPGYKELGDVESLTRFGFSAEFVRSVARRQKLWEKPLDDLCRKASTLKVKDILYTPAAGEFVDEDDTLNEGIHQLVMGRHQSLLVTRGKERRVVGVLRLTDVFFEVSRRIRACGEAGEGSGGGACAGEA